MKLSKNLLVLAVAGAVAAPAAMADAEVYGKAHVSFGMQDNDSTNGDSLYLLPNNSNVGVRGSEDLGNGLKALYQLEMAIDWSGNNGAAFPTGSSAHSLRDTYVGLNGGWGSFLMGRANSPYKMATNSLDPFADTVGDYNAVMGMSPNGNQHDSRASNALIYKTNNINGFELAGAYAVNDGLDLGDEQDRNVLSLSGTYKTGPFYLAAAYQTAMEYGPQVGASFEDDEAMKVGGTWSFAQDAGTISAMYESIDGGGNSNDRDSYYFSGTWKMGATKLALGYGMADEIGDSKDTDASQVTVGAYHSLSKATQVYALYTQLDAGKGCLHVDDGDYDCGYALTTGFAPSNSAAGEDYSAMGVVVGVIHNFSSK